jgi:hypothetical protein
MPFKSLFGLIVMVMYTALASAEDIVLERPNAALSLPIADHYASVFYTVKNEMFNVVVAFALGSDDEHLVRQTIQLVDGQIFKLSIGGYGRNEQATTIRLTRNKDVIFAHVVSCDSRDEISNCI